MIKNMLIKADEGEPAELVSFTVKHTNKKTTAYLKTKKGRFHFDVMPSELAELNSLLVEKGQNDK